MFDIYF